MSDDWTYSRFTQSMIAYPCHAITPRPLYLFFSHELLPELLSSTGTSVNDSILRRVKGQQYSMLEKKRLPQGALGYRFRSFCQYLNLCIGFEQHSDSSNVRLETGLMSFYDA